MPVQTDVIPSYKMLHFSSSLKLSKCMEYIVIVTAGVYVREKEGEKIKTEIGELCEYKRLSNGRRGKEKWGR